MADTLASVKATISRRSKRSLDRAGDNIADAVRSAIRFLQYKPFWFNEAQATLSFSQGDTYQPLPSDFAAPREAKIMVNSYLRGKRDGFREVTYSALLDAFPGSEQREPENWAIFQNRFYVGQPSDAAYSVLLIYTEKDVSLPTVDTDTSVWFGDDCVHVTTAYSMAHLYREYFHDENLANAEEAIGQRLLTELISSNNRRKSGAALYA